MARAPAPGGAGGRPWSPEEEKGRDGERSRDEDMGRGLRCPSPALCPGPPRTASLPQMNFQC